MGILIYHFFMENDSYSRYGKVQSHNRKSLINAGFQVGFSLLLMLIIGLISYYSRVGDIQIINGYVTDKKMEEVSCRHSYQCNCVTSCSGSGNNRSCTTICQTCYEHSYDVDWNVYSNIGKFSIDTVDRQGLRMPHRWEITKIGEPVSRAERYTNYIKASPDSLFRHHGLIAKYKEYLPDYPDKIYDYWHVSRLVSVGVGIKNPQEWNQGLAEINAELGAKKQVNMLVFFTNQPSDYFYALEQFWVGGKKNDVVLVIGASSEDEKPKYVQVMALTQDKVLEVKLRDGIMDLPNLNPKNVLSVFRDSVDKFYVRKHMKDFEYLKASISPSFLEILIGLILSIIGSAVFCIIVYKNSFE